MGVRTAVKQVLAGVALATLLACIAKAGTLHIGGGIVRLNGILGADTVVVDSGGVLAGNGVVVADVVNAGALAPIAESGPGSLRIIGTLSVLGDGSLVLRALTHEEVDQLIVDAALSGTLTIVIVSSSGAVPVLQDILTAGDLSGAVFLIDSGWQLSREDGTLILTDLTGNSDGNCFPDYWELAYFGQRTGIDGDDNTDGDELTHCEEYIAGTIPTNGQSTFRVMGTLGPTASDLDLQWPSASNRVYAIGVTPSLADAPFTNALADIAPAPPTNTYRITLPDWPAFYRLSVHLNTP